MRTFVHLIFTTILGFVPYFGRYICNEELNQPNVEYINYMITELNYYFELCPTLLDFQTLSAGDISILTCDTDPKHNVIVKVCTIISPIDWILNYKPKILSVSRRNVLLCLSSKDLGAVSIPILEGLNVFKVLKIRGSGKCCIRNQARVNANFDFWMNTFSNVTSFHPFGSDIVISAIFPSSFNSLAAYHAKFNVSEYELYPVTECLSVPNKDGTYKSGCNVERKPGDLFKYLLRHFSYKINKI